MKKFMYLLLFIISFSGKASDRPDDVIKTAERSFSAARHKDQPSFPHALNLTVSSFDPNLTIISESGIDRISSEKFRAEREKCNDRLMHVLNAGISLLSDYLYQAQNDDHLKWTYSIFPLQKQNGQAMPLDGYEEVILADSIICSIPNTWLCEINRQRNCLDLNTLLGLMTFWKKTIFSTDSSQSYCESNAIALKLQIIRQIENRKRTFDENIDNGLSDFGYRESIISILEDLSEAIPNQITEFVMKKMHLKQKEILKEKELLKKMNVFNSYWRELNEINLNISKKLMYLYFNPQVLFMGCSEILKESTNLYKTYLKHLSRNGKNNFTGDVLDLNKLFTTNFKIEMPYDFLEEPNLNQDIEPLKEQPLVIKEENPILDEGKIFSLHISSPEISRVIYSNIIIFLKKEDVYSLISTNRSLYRFCSEILFSMKNETIYDDTYWKSENEFHNKRKNNTTNTSSSSTSNQNINLTCYEIDLFSFLKDNIFRVNRHIKKNDFVSHLSKLFFDVKVNKNGKGSLHYVLPKSNNPVFGKHKDDSESYFNTNRPYFNIHLPHRNEVIPTGYFLYIQSGFKNVFGLSSEYVDSCLRPQNPEKCGSFPIYKHG